MKMEETKKPEHKFITFCKEVYDEMPRPVQKYYQWMGQVWKVMKPVLGQVFWYALSIYVFISIHDKYGMERTAIILAVSLIFATRRQT